MEEKELSTTISASPVNSETDSPTPLSSSAAPTHQVVLTNNNVGANNNSMGIVVTDQGLNFASTTTTTATAAAVAAAFSPASGNSNNMVKKKRGRPRKYDAEGNLRVSYTSPPLTPHPTPFSLTSGGSDQFSHSSPPSKRGRGRPVGSGNWQLLASLGEFFTNTAGGDFTPHVVTVSTGEDVASKILSFAQKGPRGVCVLSANGAVSNVTIRQPGSSGGILTYEGRFEILSLSGSFTVSDISGGRSRTGGLSVSLAGPDGRVIGGGIAGLLTAASPIQIVVGSFMPNGYKVHKRKHHREVHTTVASPPPPIHPDTVTMATPISQAKPDNNVAEHCGLIPAPPSVVVAPPDQNPNNGAPPSFGGWNGSGHGHHSHRSPDINVTLPGE